MNPIAVLPIHGVQGEHDNLGFSQTYANPFINQIDSESKAVVSLFMPKEGNRQQEIGELIYFVNFDWIKVVISLYIKTQLLRLYHKLLSIFVIGRFYFQLLFI